MWDLPSEGTWLFSKENDADLEVLAHLEKISTDELRSAYLKYEEFQNTGYTSFIHNPHSLGYKLLLKFEPASIRLNVTNEVHLRIVRMYSLVCQELARRLVYESKTTQ